MKPNVLRALASQPALRIGLAVLLILIGLAPVGVPILSDSSWRAAAAPAGENAAPITPEPTGFSYRIQGQGEAASAIERSDDGGRTWHRVASIPEGVSEVVPVPGDEQVVYARSKTALWVSRDGGATWAHSGQLPSRPMSLAVTSKSTGDVFVGTESVGLAVSRDGGETWRVVNDPTLAAGSGAPVAVTALALDPQDESILYAANGIWTGTSSTRLTPFGTYVSVDGGRLWLQMGQLPMSGGIITELSPAGGRSLSVMADDGSNVVAQQLELTPELLDELNSADPSVRASVARALGLIGASAAVQPLLDRLNDQDILVGDRVVEALALLDGENVAPALMNALTADQEAVRARAAYGLGLLRHEAAVDMLGERLRTDRPLVARRAAEALASISTPAALTALTVPLADAEMTPARHAAMMGLEQAGAESTGALLVALESQNPQVRSHAAEMLGWVGSPESVDALAAALQDDEPSVRTQAAWALGEIGTADARQALAAAQRQAADEPTRIAVASAQERAQRYTAAARPASNFGEGFVAALSSVPATSWTFFALFLALGLTLLLFTPRDVRSVRNRGERAGNGWHQ